MKVSINIDLGNTASATLEVTVEHDPKTKTFRVNAGTDFENILQGTGKTVHEALEDFTNKFKSKPAPELEVPRG